METLETRIASMDQRSTRLASVQGFIAGLETQHPELVETFSVDGPFRPLVLQWQAEELDYLAREFESENQDLLRNRGLISPVNLIKRSMTRRHLRKLRAEQEKFLESHNHEMDPWPLEDISEWAPLS